MKPQNTDDAIRKWCGGTLINRPSYYSGRGPNAGDLGERHLTMIYEGIKADFEPEIVESFVSLVEAQSDMSASAFLTAFDQWFCNGFDHESVHRSNLDGMGITGYGAERDQQALLGAMAALMDNRPDYLKNVQSEQIKAGFLHNVGRPVPKRVNVWGGYE